jgi:hypothetical protein
MIKGSGRPGACTGQKKSPRNSTDTSDSLQARTDSFYFFGYYKKYEQQQQMKCQDLNVFVSDRGDHVMDVRKSVSGSILNLVHDNKFLLHAFK